MIDKLKYKIMNISILYSMVSTLTVILFFSCDFIYESPVNHIQNSDKICTDSPDGFISLDNDNADESGKILWEVIIGGESTECANAIQQTTDDGFIIAGYTKTTIFKTSDFYIIKLNPKGDLVWTNTFGNKYSDFAYSVQQTSDGGYIVAGEKRKYRLLDDFNLSLTYRHDILIIKVDANGNMEWEKTFGGADYDRANLIIQTSDSGYIIAGHTQSYGAEYDPGPHAKKDLWIIKLDSSGEVEWEQLYGGSDSSEGANSIQQTSDDGYIICGFTSKQGSGNYDFLVLKLDYSGNIEWEKSYGGAYPENANSIIQTSEGGYIVVGETMSFGFGYYDYWILKLDSEGNIIWDNAYGGEKFERAKSVCQTSDNGYIIAGYTSSFGKGNKDCWILRLNSDGSERWTRTYGNEGMEVANSIQQTTDGNYIVAAQTSSKGAGENDIWILKLSE